MYMLEAACCSVMGKVRQNNEDNLYYAKRILPIENKGLKNVLTMQTDLSEARVFGVFDGVGGLPSGEQASYTAAAVLRERCKELKEFLFHPTDFLLETTAEMNRRVFDGGKDAATTSVMLFFQENEVYVCNVGDSKAFRLRDSGFLQLSEDHTNRKFLEEQEITGRKPSLTQCIGMDTSEYALQPYIAKGELKSGDCYLLCSDGLTDMVSNIEICDLMKTHQDVGECVRQLIKCALAHGGKDNTTAVLIRVI